MAKYFLILDIGTETVKALLFKKEKKSYAALGGVTQYVERFGNFDGKDFEKDVLKKAILEAFKMLQKAPADFKKIAVLVSLKPNFLKAKIALQTHKRTDIKNIINKREEKDILEAVFKKVRQKVSKEFARISGILPQDLEFIIQEVLETKIDGYTVPKLLGYRGEDLRFRILSIFIPKYYLLSFKKIIEDVGIKTFRIIHLSQNISRALSDRDAIFLDISDEATQIFLIRNGILEGVYDFAMGATDFSRALSRLLGFNAKAARELIKRYSKGELSEGAVRKKLKEIFSDVSREWFFHLKTKLKHLKGLIPLTFFVFGPGSSLPEIEEVLSEEGWEVKHQPDNAPLWLGEF